VCLSCKLFSTALLFFLYFVSCLSVTASAPPQQARGFAGLAALAAKITPAMFSLELPAIAEYSTGEVMGHSSDRLASAWNVSRSAQDDFAHRSHSLAAAAAAAGKLARDLVPCGGVALADNGVKVAPREKLAALKPAFVKPHGTHTAANSSFLTDGASAALLMSRSAAAAAGHAPRARLVDWAFVACDPVDELLLGPAYAVTRLLAKHKLAAADVDVWEIHEAFAGQVLANLAALDSAWFVRDKVGLPEAAKVGALPMDRVNAWGGSLALGHPFGATGVRLLTTAANRLHDGGGRFAVLAACAAGGLAHAMLIERAAVAAATA
jgi:acetyl-CoA acetyltransferase family protein